MPINKHAYIRYQVLDRCFNNVGRKFFMEDLIEECYRELSDIDPNVTSISRRTIFYDIKFMESEEGWSVPLEKPRYKKKTYYHYSDPSFSILTQPPGKTELEQIELAKLVFARLAALDEFEWMHEFVARLEESFFESHGRVIDFGRNIYLEGLDYLGTLYGAIINKQVLKITYHPFHKEDPYDSIYHPQYLKQFNDRWFLIGHQDGYENLTTYALDRIKGITEVDVPFQPLDIDFDEYYEDVIGPTRKHEDLPEDIILKFPADRAPYILTKPIHGSQKVKGLDDKGLIISIEVIVNPELVSLILSYGNDIKVIKPESLRNRVIERLQSAIDNYTEE